MQNIRVRWKFVLHARETARILACRLDGSTSGAEVLERSVPYLHPCVCRELHPLLSGARRGDTEAVTDGARQLLLRYRYWGQRALLLCNAICLLYLLPAPESVRAVYTFLERERHWGRRHVRRALLPLYASIRELSGTDVLMLLYNQSGARRERRLRALYRELQYITLQNPLEREEALRRIRPVRALSGDVQYYRSLVQTVFPDTGPCMCI